MILLQRFLMVFRVGFGCLGLSLACAAVCSAADASKSASLSSAFTVSINQKLYPNALSAEGGQPVASLTEGATMHVANISFAPLKLVLAEPIDAALIAIINDFLKGSPQSVEVSYGTASGVGIEALQAQLIEVDFGSCDASSQNESMLTLVFQPLQVKAYDASVARAAASNVTKATNKKGLQSQFQLSLGTLPSSRIVTVSGLDFKRAVSTSVARESSSNTSAGPVSLNALSVAFSLADFASWAAFEKTWLVDGHHLTGDELTGTLSWLSSDLRTPLMKLQLTGVGLISLARPSFAANSETIQRAVATWYVKSAVLSDPSLNSSAETPASPSTSTPSPAGPSTSAPATTSPSMPSPSGPSSSAPSSTTSSSTQSTTTQKTPVDVNSLPSKSTSTISTLPTKPSFPSTKNLPSAASASSALESLVPSVASDDQGAQDPADFPRIDGLRRLSYQSYAVESHQEETVVYDSKLAWDTVTKAYLDALTSAGWELVTRTDSGSASEQSLSVRLVLTKKGRKSDAVINQARAGVVQVRIELTLDRAGVLSAVIAALQGNDPGAMASGGSAADLGTSDPSALPRIAKSVRKAYASSGSGKNVEETASYRAKLPISQVEGFYVNQLTAADWELTTRRESGDPSGATHGVSMIFTAGLKKADIRLTEVEAGLTQIELSVSTSSP